MAIVTNPALAAFVAQLAAESCLGQVLIRRLPDGFELRHAADRATADLALLPISELRALATHTVDGSFRPLKAAPNLRTGWRCVATSQADLGLALAHLYPGAVADWFATQTAEPPITHYREFTARQTGMYRVTTMLTDAAAGQVTLACCAARFCLKRRLWNVPGLASDASEAKSLIPCLEPCAVLLEFARKAMRIQQEEPTPTVPLAPSELASLLKALEMALAHPPAGQREGDLAAADNPRRLQLLRQKLQGFAPVAPASSVE